MHRPKQATASQITALVDFMCEHKELSSGKIEPPYDRAAYEEEWLTLADNLNAMGGAFKSVDKWKQTWRDVKSNAKKRGFHSRRGSGSKGDYYTEKGERSVEEKIFDFVDPLAIQDLENMEDNVEHIEVDDVLCTSPAEEMAQRKSVPKTVRLKKRKRSFDYSWNSILEIEKEKLKLQKEEMDYKLRKLAVLEREDFTLQLLAKFKTKLHAIKEKVQTEGENEEKKDDKVDVADDDVNNDEWLGHTLCFEEKGAVLAKDASTKGDDWFDIYDPRNPINKRKREKSDKMTK